MIGGPIIDGHDARLLQRRAAAGQPEPRRANTPTRPDLSFTSTRRTWKGLNTLVRLDHQINANNSWALRWLREDQAPQFNLSPQRVPP